MAGLGCYLTKMSVRRVVRSPAVPGELQQSRQLGVYKTMPEGREGSVKIETTTKITSDTSPGKTECEVGQTANATTTATTGDLQTDNNHKKDQGSDTTLGALVMRQPKQNILTDGNRPNHLKPIRS